MLTSVETNEHTCVSFFPNQLEPLGKKTDTLDLTAYIPLSCPTQVIMKDLLYSSPETQSSDLALPASFSSTAFSLLILPLDWEQMDFGGWKEVGENRKRRGKYRSTYFGGMGKAGGRGGLGPKQMERIRGREVDS